MMMVRHSGKFIPQKLLTLWLRRSKQDLEEAGKLAIWEFMFILANSQDRPKAIRDKLPHTHMKLEKDSNKLTYKLDPGLNHNRAPDVWLQKIFNAQIDIKRVHFTADKLKSAKEETKQEPKKKVSIAKKSSSFLELRNMLRNPELYSQIKDTLADAKTLLKKTKIGGSQKTLQQYQETPENDFYVGPGQWTQLKHRKRPTTAKTLSKSRPVTADKNFFHLTSGGEVSVANFNSRPRLDRPLTAGTHRSTTKTAVRAI
jgi:hypothetical protein